MLNLQNALLTVSEMARADELAVQSGLSAVKLMENAGVGAARAIARRWGPRRVTILCEPGNSGGDGFVVARHLENSGWDVRLGLLGTCDELAWSAAHHARRWTGPMWKGK